MMLTTLLAAGLFQVAAPAAEPLYLRTVAQYPAPKLKQLGGREYKALLDPAKLKGDPEDAFQALFCIVRYWVAD
jgi:hypothetical protein